MANDFSIHAGYAHPASSIGLSYGLADALVAEVKSLSPRFFSKMVPSSSSMVRRFSLGRNVCIDKTTWPARYAVQRSYCSGAGSPSSGSCRLAGLQVHAVQRSYSQPSSGTCRLAVLQMHAVQRSYCVCPHAVQRTYSLKYSTPLQPSSGFTGEFRACLACRCAYHVNAGLVSIAILQSMNDFPVTQVQGVEIVSGTGNPGLQDQ